MKYLAKSYLVLFLLLSWIVGGHTQAQILLTNNSLSAFTNTYTIPSDPIITVSVAGGTPEVITDPVHTVNICVGQSIRLEANSTGVGTLSYEWFDPATGNVFSETSVLEGTLSEGQYNVNVTDDDGTITSTITIIICVTNVPPLNVSLDMPLISSLCSGGGASIFLSANAENSGTVLCTPSFEWYKDGSPISGQTGSTLEIANMASNVGIYTVRATNACGAVSASQSVEITLTNATPNTLNISSEDDSDLVCSGGTLNLLATATGTVDYFEWYQVGNPAPIGTGSSLLISDPGNYRFRAYNGCGFTESSILNVLLGTPPPSLVISNFPNPPSVCVGNSVMLAANITGSGGAIERYEWYRSEGGVDFLLTTYETSSPADAIFTTDVAGDYFVRVTNKCGSSDSPPRTIEIVQPPTYVNILPDGPPSITTTCTPPRNSVTLNADTDASSTNLIYEWFLNGTPLGINSSSMVATSTGNYTLSVSADLPNGTSCGSLTSSVLTIVEVNDFTVTDINLSSGTVSTCTGSISLSTDDLGNGVLYEWYRDGALAGTTTTPNFSAEEGGTYQVQASNACGISNFSSSLDLDIELTPSNAQILPDGPTNTCGASSITLYGTAEGSNLTYEWLRDGVVVSNLQNYTTDLSGDYIFRVSNTCGTTNSTALSVRFNIVPNTDDVLINASLCENPVELSVSTSGTNLEYRWFREGIGLVGTASTYGANASGDYYVQVRNECMPAGVWITSPTVSILVGSNLPTPVIESSPTSGVQAVCPDNTLTLQADAAVGGGVMLGYRWFKDNILFDDSNSASIDVNESGQYQVEIFALSDESCSKISLPYTVFVRTNPQILFSYRGRLNFCEGDSVRLQANSQVTLPPSQFNWYRDGNLILSGVNFIDAKEGGTYEAEAIYNNSISGFPCDLSIRQSISLNTVSAPRPEIIFEDGMLSVLTDASQYQWFFNNAPILGENQNNYYPIDSGYYAVSLRNEFGCEGLSEELYHPGVYPSQDEKLRISPNPSTGSARITFLSEEDVQLFIYDSQGRLLINRPILPVNILTTQSIFMIEDLAPGIYLVRVQDSQGVYSKKLVVH